MNHYNYLLLIGTLFSACSHGYVDIAQLQKSTRLSKKIIQDAVNEFQSVERGQEVGAYYQLVPEFLKKFNLKKGCEVGVYTGGLSYTILKNSNVELLYSIDPYHPSLFKDLVTRNLLELYFLTREARLGQFETRSKMIRMFSVDASKLFNDYELDFVFLDGDHEYESVKQDLIAWYGKIRKGGVIMGDDYATRWPGVPQAVNEFFNALNLPVNQLEGSPRTWWVQKP